MKKILIVILVALLCLSFVGCRKAQEQAVENMLENMLESASDGEVDIDFNDDGSSFTISGEDGETTYQSDENGMAWPGDEFPNSVPELKGVKFITYASSDTGTSLFFEDCTDEIGEDYIKDIEQKGWDIVMNMDSDSFHMVSATKGDTETLTFTWDEEDNSGQIV